MLMRNEILTTHDLNTTVSQYLTQPYSKVSDKQEVDDQLLTTSYDEKKQQQTQPFEPNQLIQWLTYPNQQTIEISLFKPNALKEKQEDIMKYIFNIDYISFKFQEVNEKLDYSKGGYSDVCIVKDQKDRKLIRKKVTNPSAFLNELRFFQQMENEYLVNIYYYSKCDQEFYLEKGDETLYSFFKKNTIKNRFFLFLLCLTIIEAVTSLHVSNIFHGDIKPQNIIIFYKNGFKLDNLQQDQDICIKDIQQFLAIESFLKFDFEGFQGSPDYKFVDNENINFSDLFNAIYRNSHKEEIKQNYKSFSQMLEKLFCVTIKFIDFQSSSKLNSVQKICYYTKAFTCKKFINKMKSEYLNFLDKMYVDHYSTFRTILMILNFQYIQNFYTLDDSSSIYKTEDSILKSLLLSYQFHLENVFIQKKDVNQTAKKLLIKLPFQNIQLTS
ncbi:kinase domain protein (macronuclear) [Tetrahymena thermophila SB210]|uniref:Kinase domain protein n=1 Tax=Tetrahymena thermophila (strain SB210) TaxID=312017 RepID=Q233A0_TETTS|nr:kinase domain protein [Tetrahymena thermophila SB210]EAR91680.1 kinase domain protein [Tetrahymena thermophila SB210]|eukprot:XP_001011925.1 kinase domain protein [Tetrahymena thermophila SB210]